jgi:hypothetical protein
MLCSSSICAAAQPDTLYQTAHEGPEKAMAQTKGCAHKQQNKRVHTKHQCAANRRLATEQTVLRFSRHGRHDPPLEQEFP